jgi:hypothetical protein
MESERGGRKIDYVSPAKREKKMPSGFLSKAKLIDFLSSLCRRFIE